MKQNGISNFRSFKVVHLSWMVAARNIKILHQLFSSCRSWCSCCIQIWFPPNTHSNFWYLSRTKTSRAFLLNKMLRYNWNKCICAILAFEILSSIFAQWGNPIDRQLHSGDSVTFYFYENKVHMKLHLIIARKWKR